MIGCRHELGAPTTIDTEVSCEMPVRGSTEAAPAVVEYQEL